MADWNLQDGAGTANVFLTTSAATIAGSLAGPGGSNVYSAWTQLTASIPFEVYGLLVQVQCSGGGGTTVFDLGLGALGSEVAVVAALPGLNGTIAQAGGPKLHYLPLALPMGQRLAARCQRSAGSQTVLLSLTLFRAGFASERPYTVNTLYGYNSGTTVGTAIDPGASANTKGAWVQLTASTTQAAKAISLELSSGSNNGGAQWAVDVGVGSAGNEVAAIPNLYVTSSTTVTVIDVVSLGPFPCNVPAGTRLSLRCQSNASTINQRNLQAQLRTWA